MMIESRMPGLPMPQRSFCPLTDRIKASTPSA